MKRVNLYTLLLAAAGLCNISESSAQNYTDVLRYSSWYPQGTARSVAAGNAFGALGGDFSSLGINPAGLGIYKSSEFTGSFDFNHQTTNTSYLGNPTGDDKYNLNLSNIGLVLANPQFRMNKPVEQGWVSLNFAIGYNRINNFQTNYRAEGYNSSNSILNSWREDAAKNKIPDQFGLNTWLGYNTGVIGKDSSTNEWQDASQFEAANTKYYQRDAISTRGAMNDLQLAFAGNYSNRLYIGGAISVPVISYYSDRTFTEANTGTTPNYYRGLSLNETVSTSGVGITGRLGLIYRLTDNFRIGLAGQLPSFYSLHDDYKSTLDTRLVGVKETDSSVHAEYPGNYDYSIVTPGKATLSVAYLFGVGTENAGGTKGFISADVDYVDYSSARFNSGGETFSSDNDYLKTRMAQTFNARIGAEVRSGILAVRAGYGYYMSPYSPNIVPSGYDMRSYVYSFGLGLREDDYFIDLAYQLQQQYYYTLPYSLDAGTVTGSQTTATRGSIFMTLGLKF